MISSNPLAGFKILWVEGLEFEVEERDYRRYILRYAILFKSLNTVFLGLVTIRNGTAAGMPL